MALRTCLKESQILKLWGVKDFDSFGDFKDKKPVLQAWIDSNLFKDGGGDVPVLFVKHDLFDDQTANLWRREEGDDYLD